MPTGALRCLQQHTPVGAVDHHQASRGGLLHSGTLLAHLLRAGEHPHPATGAPLWW